MGDSWPEKKETDGSPSPLPDINDIGKAKSESAIYILFMILLLMS